jgi:eukaryotic-like serine/threonine-protein kinase
MLASARAMQAGTIIGGRYELVEPVGEGGMSTVWYGVARSSVVFTRPLAIKVMKRTFSAVQPHLAMFLEEARIGAELQHPHLVQVVDFLAEAAVPGAGPGVSYCLVMEWIEGIDLRSLIRTLARLERPLPWGLVAHVGIGVLRGLAAAHERKLYDGTAAPVIHRDVSPQNVLLGLNGAIKLGDFGMARAKDRGTHLTAPGIVKGTVSYLAPEVLLGKPPTAQSDLFSLGCTLWEALAGERLFDARTDAAVVDAIRNGRIRPLEDERPDLPPRLAAAVHRALAVDPQQRFPSARALIQELGEILREGGPWFDSDVVIGTTVAQAREAAGRLKAGDK